jgi:hypothetical protein
MQQLTQIPWSNISQVTCSCTFIVMLLYLSEAQARSRVRGAFVLTDCTTNTSATPSPISTPPPHNGAVHTIGIIVRNAMASETEAELISLFHNAWDGTLLRTALIEMEQSQAEMPNQSDNACVSGIVNQTVTQHHSKVICMIDMHFYWIQDKIKQDQFLVCWRWGADNLLNYFTKHHSPDHRRLMRSRYLLPLHDKENRAKHN